MNEAFREHWERQLAALRKAGLLKEERVLASEQDAWVTLSNGRRVLNLCSNNYLGLASHPEVVAAARDALQQYGFGLASVRFICGTQALHRDLEKKLSEFLGTEDTLLYSSCFDANGGLFETLLGEEDAVLSDELNHASIIDGLRLCKAKRFRYRHSDLGDLEARLREADGARFKMIATDGVFSMDGEVARLKEICGLAERFGAQVMVDDSHATGVLGARGRGTHEHCGVMGRVDLLTGTLGKALGGASGGYASGRREVIAWLRQRSRPYLFSNTLAPALLAGAQRALALAARYGKRRARLRQHARRMRAGLRALGFEVREGEHPIIPVMVGEAQRATELSAKLLEEGVFAVGFSYPVVPQNLARVRLQVSAAHSREDLDFALKAFERAKAGLEWAK